MRISLKHLRYFVALSDEGSFVAAADRVHVTQPALSQQIKDMERQLGVQLVERLPREIRLTRSGRIALERARKIISDVHDLEDAVGQQKGLSGTLSLGVIPTVAPYLLPLALTGVRSRDLSLELRVREAQTEVLIDDLKRGKLDAAIMALPASEGGLIAKPLFDDHFVLAGSATRLNSLRDTHDALRPTSLDPDSLLLLDEGHCLADQALEICGLASRRKVDLGASSLATLCGLVSEGFGLTFVPEIALKSETAAQPSLATKRFSAPEPKRVIALVRRETSLDDGWATDLEEILRQAGQELLAHARTIGD